MSSLRLRFSINKLQCGVSFYSNIFFAITKNIGHDLMMSRMFTVHSKIFIWTGTFITESLVSAASSILTSPVGKNKHK